MSPVPNASGRKRLAPPLAAVAALLAFVLALAAVPDPSVAAEKKAGGKPPREMMVGVDAVIRQPLQQTVPIIGRFVPLRTGVVAARVSGPVGEVRVEVGDRVEAGGVIAVLVQDLLKWRHQLQKAEVSRYAAALGTRKARTKLRRQEMKRLEKLMESAAFSQARLDDKRQEVTVAESEAIEAEGKLAGARANLKLTQTNLSYAVVRAPYAGVVSKRHIEVGAYVNIGEPLVTLIDDTHLEIEAEVPANRTVGLTPGTKVAAFLEGGRLIAARVRAVVPEENPQTRTQTVRFVPELPPDLGALASNRSVTLHLPAGNDGIVVTVHKDAVIIRRGRTLVYIVQGNSAAVRPVRLGEAVGTRFIVDAGLVPGDLVVVRGNERLLPGQKIRFKAPGVGAGGGAKGGAKAASQPRKVKG